MPLKRSLQQYPSIDLSPMIRFSRFRRGDYPGPIKPETEGLLFEKNERLPAKLEKWTPSNLLSPRGKDKGGGRDFWNFLERGLFFVWLSFLPRTWYGGIQALYSSSDSCSPLSRGQVSRLRAESLRRASTGMILREPVQNHWQFSNLDTNENHLLKMLKKRSMPVFSIFDTASNSPASSHIPSQPEHRSIFIPL